MTLGGCYGSIQPPRTDSFHACQRDSRGAASAVCESAMTTDSRHTHIWQINGSGRSALTDGVRSHADQLRFTLNRMDGSSIWAISLWRVPQGANLRHSIPLSEEYIQCAGTAEAMTVEVRVVSGDTAARQYVVGKPSADNAGEPSEIIRWDEDRSSTKVCPNEVFTADEAADVFHAYFLSDDVPSTYSLRERNLNWPTSELTKP